LLAAQEEALTRSAEEIDRSRSYVKRARALLARTSAPTVAELVEILEHSKMTTLPKAIEGLVPELTDAQKEDLAKRNFTEADQAEVSARWEKVFAEAEALAGSDPAAPRAEAMAREARDLIDWFTGGDPGLHRAAGSVWQKAWSDPERARMMPISREGWVFLQEAQAALAQKEAAKKS